jgi:hypothetical protein
MINNQRCSLLGVFAELLAMNVAERRDGDAAAMDAGWRHVKLRGTSSELNPMKIEGNTARTPRPNSVSARSEADCARTGSPLPIAFWQSFSRWWP